MWNMLEESLCILTKHIQGSFHTYKPHRYTGNFLLDCKQLHSHKRICYFYRYRSALSTESQKCIPHIYPRLDIYVDWTGMTLEWYHLLFQKFRHFCYNYIHQNNKMAVPSLRHMQSHLYYRIDILQPCKYQYCLNK